MVKWWHAALFSVALALLTFAGVWSYHARPYANTDLPAPPAADAAETAAEPAASETGETGAAAPAEAATAPAEAAEEAAPFGLIPPPATPPASPPAQPQLPAVPPVDTGLGPEGMTSTGGTAPVTSTGGRVGGMPTAPVTE